MLIKKVDFVKSYLKGSNLEPFVTRLWFSRLGRFDQRYKDAVFVEKYLFIALVVEVFTFLHYAKLPPKQFFRQVFLKD